MSWSRNELEEAFASFQKNVANCVATDDWSGFADMFTEDVTYVEHAFGTMHGREAVREWVVRTMTSFPGSHMTKFPPTWYMVDEERGWIVCEINNPMTDPGDGSEFETANITILHYAGDNLWSYEEDAYNPMNFFRTAKKWCRAAEAAGTLPDAAREWMTKVGVK